MCIHHNQIKVESVLANKHQDGEETVGIGQARAKGEGSWFSSFSLGDEVRVVLFTAYIESSRLDHIGSETSTKKSSSNDSKLTLDKYDPFEIYVP